MTQNLTQNLVSHGGIGLAPHMVAELGFNHHESGFDIAPLMVMGKELFLIEREVMEHALPSLASVTARGSFVRSKSLAVGAGIEPASRGISTSLWFCRPDPYHSGNPPLKAASESIASQTFASHSQHTFRLFPFLIFSKCIHVSFVSDFVENSIQEFPYSFRLAGFCHRVFDHSLPSRCHHLRAHSWRHQIRGIFQEICACILVIINFGRVGLFHTAKDGVNRCHWICVSSETKSTVFGMFPNLSRRKWYRVFSEAGYSKSDLNGFRDICRTLENIQYGLFPEPLIFGKKICGSSDECPHIFNPLGDLPLSRFKRIKFRPSFLNLITIFVRRRIHVA